MSVVAFRRPGRGRATGGSEFRIGNSCGLLIVYRSHGGENMKSRPPYYSKLLGLASMVRAAEALAERPEIVYLNDGPIPEARLGVMRSTGRIVQVSAGSNRESFRTAVSIAAAAVSSSASAAGSRGRVPSETLVWFAEDDYLYSPDSFHLLMQAASALPQADYVSLYGSYALDPSCGGRRPIERPERRSAGDPHAIELGRTRWYRAISSTSTFAVRADVLASDRRLLRMCPYAGGGWDHTTCLVYQGYRPYGWEELRPDLLSYPAPLREWPRSISRGLIHSSFNARAMRRPSRRRVILCADPEPITHMEMPHIAEGTDWAAMADETARWAVARRIAGFENMGADGIR